MTGEAPVLTAAFWRTRRAAAISGIVSGLLLLTAMTMMRAAISGSAFEDLQSDQQRRALVAYSLYLIPFAGIAFLWFIGVVREQLGEVEDRLFSTVFLGSGLLFLALLFAGAVTASSMLVMLEDPRASPEVWAFGQENTRGLLAVYAMRMAAVFTLSVCTAALRTSSVPRPVCYVGYVVAIGLLLAPSGQSWVHLMFPGWVLLVSGSLLLSRPRPGPHPV
jgi:hypothetical protein